MLLSHKVSPAPAEKGLLIQSPTSPTLPTPQVHAVVGVLSDNTDPMVAVMKLEKDPTESYADIGGLDTQIQVEKIEIGRKS